MNDDARRFLQTLLETPSPSGYERPIQQVVRDYATPFADRVTTDVHGNVIACRNPAAPLRVMYAGHCDQIGMLVTQIDDSGFIYAETIGGWDSQQLIGQRMTIWTAQGPWPPSSLASPSTCSTNKNASKWSSWKNCGSTSVPTTRARRRELSAWGTR